jgi:hypothetical protein
VREFITPDIRASELRLIRTVHSGAILLVEGVDDAKVYRCMIDESVCQLVVQGNKDMAIKVLKILNQEQFAGLVTIVDKDFDELVGTLPKMDNLCFTDTHDLETMLVQSPALEKVLGEFGSIEKLQNLDVRALLLVAASPIGYLLWISLQDQINLDFKRIEYGKFLNEALQPNELKLIQEVKNKSQRLDLVDRDLQKRLNQQRDPLHDLWQVCRGHDLTGILAHGLRKALGSNKPADVTPEVIERSLRLAYEFAYFCQTQLYKALRDWENAHSPYRLLPIQPLRDVQP